MKLKEFLTIFLIMVIGVFSISCNESTSNESTSEACVHAWWDANCTTPKVCLKCNASEGEALGHKWIEASCTEPRTCSICGETEGESSGHEWVEASCTTPKTCTKCNKTEGEIGEHSDSGNGKCKYCEEDIFLMELKEGLNIQLLIPSVGANNCYCTIKISNNTAYKITDIGKIASVNGAALYCFSEPRSSMSPKETQKITFYTTYIESKKYNKDTYTLYLDNNSTGIKSFVINGVRVYFRYGVNGIIDAGYSLEDVQF